MFEIHRLTGTASEKLDAYPTRDEAVAYVKGYVTAGEVHGIDLPDCLWVEDGAGRCSHVWYGALGFEDVT